MTLFITAELDHTVDEGFLEARAEVQTVFARLLGPRSYSPAVSDWYLIAIIMPEGPDESGFPEVKKYVRREKSVEFRLALPYREFLAADQLKRQRLLCGLLLRSVSEAETLGIRDFDGERMREHIERAAARRGWIKG